MVENKEKAKEYAKNEYSEEISNKKDKNGGMGSIVVKKQQNSQTDGTYGPYAWYVAPPSQGREWTYLGPVKGYSSETNAESTQAEEEMPVVREVLGEIPEETTSMGMNTELRDGEIYAKADTGNRHFVGVATGWDDGDMELDYAAYQKGKTKKRAEGTADIEPGDIVKYKRWTHSGKNSKSRYAVYDGDDLHKVSKEDAREIVYRRNANIPDNGVVIDNRDRFNVDTTREGDGWIQRIYDYDPDEYAYNWGSDFENDPITAYKPGEVVRTSRDKFYEVTEDGLSKIDEDTARSIARED